MGDLINCFELATQSIYQHGNQKTHIKYLYGEVVKLNFALRSKFFIEFVYIQFSQIEQRMTIYFVCSIYFFEISYTSRSFRVRRDRGRAVRVWNTWTLFSREFRHFSSISEM